MPKLLWIRFNRKICEAYVSTNNGEKKRIIILFIYVFNNFFHFFHRVFYKNKWAPTAFVRGHPILLIWFEASVYTPLRHFWQNEYCLFWELFCYENRLFHFSAQAIDLISVIPHCSSASADATTQLSASANAFRSAFAAVRRSLLLVSRISLRSFTRSS